MKYLKPLLITAAIIILISFLTIKIYYHYDLPKYDGTKQIKGLINIVEVFTDEFGVPHVFANKDEDLFFAAGYIIARERLFQMSLLAAIMHGEISSLLGDGYLQHDKYIIKNRGKFFNNNISEVNDQNLLLIESYCSGINSYIDEISKRLPIEFKIINSKPIKWTTSDAVDVLSLMTNGRIGEKRKGLVLDAVSRYFGESRYAELNYRGKGQTLNKDSLSIKDLKIEDDILALVGAGGSLVGSDAFIVSTDTKPLLIFDDIGDLQQPSKWFDIHLKSENFNVEGSVVPGFPLPLVGKTAKSAFAFTGETYDDKINTIFDIINNDANMDNINITNNTMHFADTTGFYFGQIPGSKHLNILKDKISNIDDVTTDEVINAFSGYINSEKAETINYIIEKYLEGKTNSDQVIEGLLNWNGNESSESEQALLVNIIYKNLIYGIFEDELTLIGNDIFDLFIKTPKFAENSLKKVLYNSESSWLDNVNTVEYNENLSDIIDMAVDNALKEIQNKFGSTNWQWGALNQPIYKHVLGDKTLMCIINGLNIGPIQRKGSNTGVNVNEFNYTKNLEAVSGIALRRIFDLSDPSISYSIVPTGQSGLPKSTHYSDQLELFNRQEFRKIDFNFDNIVNNDIYQKLILYPAE